jgi:hypothetical protein
MISKTLRTLVPRHATMAIVILLCFSASPAQAGKTCGAFTVVLDTGAVFRGKQDLVIPASRLGQTAHVRGTFAQFDVDLTTFTVFSYELTAASDVTAGHDKIIFLSKTPELAAPLTGSLTLRINNEQLVLIRAGATNKMKIQAKDCSTGGLFQMEPDRPALIHHELADGFHYFNDNLGRTLFTDGVTIGRESPQFASFVSRTVTESLWQVQGGGRMGAVFGEDAIQP